MALEMEIASEMGLALEVALAMEMDLVMAMEMALPMEMEVVMALAMSLAVALEMVMADKYETIIDTEGDAEKVCAVIKRFGGIKPFKAVSYTHLTLPTNREV